MKILIPFSGGVNSTHALWRWLSQTSHDIAAVYADETWPDQREVGRGTRERAAADAIVAWLRSNVRDFAYEITQWPANYAQKLAPIRNGFTNTMDVGVVEPRYAGYKALIDAHMPHGIVIGMSLENTAVDTYPNFRSQFETPGVDVYLAGCPTLDPIAQGDALDYDVVAATMIGRFQQLEELPRELVALIVPKCSSRHDATATDGSAVLCMSCLYEDVRAARTDMTGAELDAAFAEYGQYGQWRHLADPAAYQYRNVPQIKALELLGVNREPHP